MSVLCLPRSASSKRGRTSPGSPPAPSLPPAAARSSSSCTSSTMSTHRGWSSARLECPWLWRAGSSSGSRRAGGSGRTVSANQHASRLVVVSTRSLNHIPCCRAGLPWAVAGANARTEDGEAAESEGEKLTKEIDALGMRWLCMALYPLVGAWGVYSLLYYPHKSWWSWLINTLANGVCKPPAEQSPVPCGSYGLVVLSLVVSPQFRLSAELFDGRDRSCGGSVRLVWVCDDDAAALHQLQAQVRRAPTVARLHVQGLQHVHR